MKIPILKSPPIKKKASAREFIFSRPLFYKRDPANGAINK